MITAAVLETFPDHRPELPFRRKNNPVKKLCFERPNEILHAVFICGVTGGNFPISIRLKLILKQLPY